MLSLAGTATDGIKISGICADGIEISAAATTTGLNVSADCVTGITVAAQTTAGITIAATATGLHITGATTTGIHIAGTSTTGLNISGAATNDISLQNGATITNGAAAVLTITEPTVTMACSTKFDVNGMIDVADVLTGGASNGNIIKKTLQASEDYTGTTAGLMVKCYGADGTATVSSGEFTGLYVNVKGLHTSPGNNASLISAHAHASNTTVIHAGLWLYGDMTNGVKASGSTLTSMIDISEATAVANFADFAAGSQGTHCLFAATNTPAIATTHALQIDVGGVAHYIPVYDDYTWAS
jgi:hypothetical protein